ncbi:alpha/beta hydrolase [uncultured Oxalicibacterium sp.]|uniref:alpha/beta fold hydrolase n=1 Tax=uncultured Oxalicibacterium sp. TaxID=1168540 RepID=UPI0025F22007|nr:alpha/beta hydrolase [uncultured Oxalicibacterium sp.]
MKAPASRYVRCMSPAGLHRLAYKEWGDAANPRVLVCVHGLTRVSDDFDVIAAKLCEHYRVICPDIVGRGRSDHLRDPLHYQVPQYIADMVTLIARLDVEQVDWLGTSMGGLIGIGLAAQPQRLIRRLVLNDIGPALNPQAMARIAEYVGQAPSFASFEKARDYVKLISASFGEHDDAQWNKLARDVLKEEQGVWHFAYDPALAVPFKAMTPQTIAQAEQTLWAAYDAIRCPTLLLRGANSDMLSPATAQEMTQRGPKAQLQVLQNVGHAPTLLDNVQIALVKDFLLA